jgi:hypothetical protein
MAISGLQNRNIVGAFYNAHHSPEGGLVLSQPLASWSINSSRLSCTEGGIIHFSAMPLPAVGSFSKADLLTIAMFAKFRWDFGDAGAGTWDSDGTSRNAAHGPETGHAFHAVGAGSYTVTLYVTEGGIETSVATLAITVNAADTVYTGANTFCFSNTADFTGAPAGATQITTSSFDTAWANAATGKRLMFKGGDTFTCSASVAKSTSAVIDNLMLDSFGTGKAIIQSSITSGGAIIDMGAASAFTNKNHTIRNLRFQGTQSATVSYSGISYHNYNEHLSIADNEFILINNAISANSNDLSIQTNITQPRFGIGIHGNLIDNLTTPLIYAPNGNMQIFASGKKFSILGNTCKNGDGTAVGDSHMVRLALVQHLAVANNNFTFGSKNSRHTLKIHGDYFKGSNLDGTPRWFVKSDPPISQPLLTTKWDSWTFNEFIYVGENRNESLVDGQDWPFILGPQDEWSPEEVRGVVVSNNYFTGVYGQQAIIAEGSTIAIRNNVVNAAQWPTCGIVYVNPSKYVIGSSGHFLYKNTLYKKNSVSGNAARASIHMGSGIYAKDAVINNNLVYSLPKDAGNLPVAGLADTAIGFTYTEAGNSYDPVTYPFTGTNPPGDSVGQFTLISSGAGADVGDY